MKMFGFNSKKNSPEQSAANFAPCASLCSAHNMLFAVSTVLMVVLAFIFVRISLALVIINAIIICNAINQISKQKCLFSAEC